jgi:hypothetical protein
MNIKVKLVSGSQINLKKYRYWDINFMNIGLGVKG